MSRLRTPTVRRTAGAAAVALALHLGLVVSLGLQAPRLRAHTPPAPAMMDMMLVGAVPTTERPAARASASARAPVELRARPPAVSAETPPLVAIDAAPAPSTAVAEAAPGAGEVGCAREVLMLLTEAEKERCRDQIAADNARRARPGKEARDAEAIRDARNQPKADLIPPEKRAYYDALVAAKKAIRPQPGVAARSWGPDPRGPGGMASKNTNIDVAVAMPKCSLQFGPNKAKHRPKIGEFKLGFLPCYFQVPRGSLTEEAGVELP